MRVLNEIIKAKTMQKEKKKEKERENKEKELKDFLWHIAVYFELSFMKNSSRKLH